MVKFQLILIAISLWLVASYMIPIRYTHETAFDDFQVKYDKSYGSREETAYRRDVFHTNLLRIEAHNAQTGISYKLGINRFTDLTTEEFHKLYLPSRGKPFKYRAQNIKEQSSNGLPTSIDWRSQNVVTPIKDQQHCGSCWSFSATGSLEGAFARKDNVLRSFSEQQLVDCSKKYGNQGCQGGLMTSAFDYIKKFGIELEDNYPYQGQSGVCQYNATAAKWTVKKYVTIQSGNEDALQNAVAQTGPVSVAIDASHWSFQLYESGIYNESNCSSVSLNHGVLVVGYGTENGTPYWLVKNSWGLSWGSAGYIRMSRNADNQCGIATTAVYPIV